MSFRYLFFKSTVIYLAMICTQPIPQWISMTAPATDAGKYVMQLQSFNIMDVCSLNPTTLCFWHNLAPSPEYIPEEQFTVSVMLNILPTHPSTRPFIQLPSLCYTHTPTLQQVKGNHIAWKTSWVKCTRSAFFPVSVEMPLSKTRRTNCSSTSSLNWNCEQCIKLSHQACFWLELRAEQGSGLWRQREDQR